MRLSYETYSLPKAGNAEEENEDACCPCATRLEVDSFPFRCAVADGATESSFSREWARRLVEAFVEDGENPQRGQPGGPRRLPRLVPPFAGKREGRLHSWPGRTLPRVREEWAREVDTRELPWYAEAKARQGAYSSLLGVVLTNAEARPRRGGALRWQALAVGDSCVIHVRRNGRSTSFPLQRPEEFGNQPYLIGSRPGRDDDAQQHLRTLGRGVLRPGEVLYMMTDALACWFLSRQRIGGTSEDSLQGVHCLESFGKLVMRERRERDPDGRPSLRNDDVTLVRLQLLSG
jgi:hypothetical protein